MAGTHQPDNPQPGGGSERPAAAEIDSCYAKSQEEKNRRSILSPDLLDVVLVVDLVRPDYGRTHDWVCRGVAGATVLEV